MSPPPPQPPGLGGPPLRDPGALARTQLFAGLAPDELAAVAERARERSFARGEQLCREGEAPERIWVITSGLVHWRAVATQGGGEVQLRMRRGDVIGAQDALTGTERSATVIATTATSALELTAADLDELARRFPQILLNVIHTQRERLFRASAQSAALFSASARSDTLSRGEEVGLVAGPSLKGVAELVARTARSASADPVIVVDRTLSFAGALTASGDLSTENATVLIHGDLDLDRLGVMLDEVDRVVAIAGNAEEAQRLGRVAAEVAGRRLELVLVSDEARQASRAWPLSVIDMVIRECPRQPGYPLSDADIGWLARHVTRTKLGLALGAGGAKGYAHVGVLETLEREGYTVDYVGGSSIGGFVATQIALGRPAAEVLERFRAAFSEEHTAKLFATPLVGTAGLEVLTDMLKQATDERFFADTLIPLSLLAVDLTERAPVVQRSGALWQALLAGLSVAGVFPAQERSGHRLIDAIALVPVPSGAVIEHGADVVVSVNLLGAETLERWPGQPPEPEPDPDEPPKKVRRKGPLDTILEAMDLSQLDTSARHAALADVTLTPRFGPAEWRDFGMWERFLESGREAAEAALGELRGLARPVDLDALRRETISF